MIQMGKEYTLGDSRRLRYMTARRETDGEARLTGIRVKGHWKESSLLV